MSNGRFSKSMAAFRGSVLAVDMIISAPYSDLAMAN